jgi:hypothetical protein
MATASAAMSMAMLANADVVWGAMECRAIYSKPGVEVLDGTAISDDHTIIYLTSALPDLVRGESLAIAPDGEAVGNFTTRAPRQMDDGLLSYVGLNPA